MLVRMYNLAMHGRFPLENVPYQWMMHWSRLLERDLEQRRLESRNRSQRNALQAARMRALRR